MWSALAGRDLPPEEKAAALVERAHVYRELDEYPAMVRSLREAVEVAGWNTQTGQGAAYQLGWAHAYAGDPQAALEAADRLALQPGVAPALKTSARWSAALFAERTGDLGRARRELEALVAEFEDDEVEYYRNIAKLASERLAKLR